MKEDFHYILQARKKEDDAERVAVKSTIEDASTFVRTLDQHPTGGVLLLLIITAVVWYMANNKR